MDAYEATKIVYKRIQNLDPQNSSKIMGILLIQDHGEKEMIRLAFGPESLLHSVIHKAKKELDLATTPNMPSTPSSPSSPSPFSRHNFSSSSSRLMNNANGLNLPSPLSILANNNNNNHHNNNNQSSTTALSSSWTNSINSFSDDLVSPNYNNNSPPSTMNSSAPPFYVNNNNDHGEVVDLIDELHLQDQLSFLNDHHGSPQLGPSKSPDFFTSSPSYAAAWGGGASGLNHRRSCSVSDICLGSDDLSGGFGWKPCLFYARGYCKNGAGCRFVHGGGGDAVADGGGAVVGSPGNGFPFSPTANKCLSFLQLPPDSPRGLMMGDGMSKFGRRGEFGLNGINHGSRQIYLTFPADSTFKEEDVSNYFSNFGPVQDVRIPYQQKRMFGFVTFDFSETVKLILAKGNPHFVCDARVLVKPYKEKGKIPDKHRKQQQMERVEFTGCGSPTGLESRDPFDLGARMFYNTQDMLWRRKLEEQADLQQAIELQNRRLMGLQLLDVKRNSHHRTLSTGAVISSPTTFSPTFFNQNVVLPSNRSSPEAIEENGSIGSVNGIDKGKDFSAEDENINEKDSSPPKESDFRQSLEHNLPDSPFASPKAAVDYVTAFSMDTSEADKGISVQSTNNNLISGPKLFAANSSLDMAPFKSCYFQVPRFASGHETIGM